MPDSFGSTTRPCDQTALAAVLTTQRMSVFGHHTTKRCLVGAADVVKYLNDCGSIAGLRCLDLRLLSALGVLVEAPSSNASSRW